MPEFVNKIDLSIQRLNDKKIQELTQKLNQTQKLLDEKDLDKRKGLKLKPTRQNKQ